MQVKAVKIIQKIDEEYKKTFPKDFYLWSERGFWLQKIKELLQKQSKRKEAKNEN